MIDIVPHGDAGSICSTVEVPLVPDAALVSAGSPGLSDMCGKRSDPVASRTYRP